MQCIMYHLFVKNASTAGGSWLTKWTLVDDKQSYCRYIVGYKIVTKYGLTQLSGFYRLVGNLLILIWCWSWWRANSWDPDWSCLVKTKSSTISGLAQVEFQWSDSEFLAPGEAPNLYFGGHLFVISAHWASMQHLSSLLIEITCPVRLCYPWPNLKVPSNIHAPWYWITAMSEDSLVWLFNFTRQIGWVKQSPLMESVWQHFGWLNCGVCYGFGGKMMETT